MSSVSSPAPSSGTGFPKRTWFAIAVIATLFLVLLIGKFGGFFDPIKLGAAMGEWIRSFADSPFGLPALIIAFCICAFIAVPQFVLIGVAIYAFGPGLGSLYSWVATLVSGSLTYGVGRISGGSVLSQISSRRLDSFAKFIDRNAFIASAVVRNVPAGPFLFVNMAFGAFKARYLSYLGGMALGVIPKIAVVGLAGKGIRAAVEGNPLLALAMGVAAVLVFIGVWMYRRHRRKTGNIIPLQAKQAVDSE